MHRTSVLRRSLMALAAAALAAGCTTQATGGGAAGSTPAGGDAKAPASSPTRAPDDAKPKASPASVTPSPSPTAQPKVLMAEGTENEQVRELQARLRQIGHFHRSPTAFYGSMTSTAVSAFQGKRGLPTTGSVDEVTWERLIGLSRTPTADELRPSTTNTLDKPDARCMTGRVLCISKESRTLAWMIDGTVVAAMDVRFGSENTPTREGTFSVGWKARKWESTIYHTPMPYAMFFSGGQAVHYSADFAARGYNGASHGCVNVRDKGKIASVFSQVKVGDKVVVHW
ncbi:L,D-transpeptidase family protein [Streptomyces sp. NBC_01619]|uniref:L,D-transpeptidase family protein n=1 Tax=Streptomyces pratisoli TaxID=3139917 RepID=A0ACC6QLP2_9ACTN|nr:MULTISPECIES: L,D-transpeptidase family protein [unclassified Streptomyces]MCX4512803.1 L,D-transpeptidase family protein [Streptomyces sp. NBC_01619]